MLRGLAIGLLIFTGVATATAEEWSWRARDVYVNGRLERDARVWAANGRVAVVSASLPRVLVFDPEAASVGWLERGALEPGGDPASARSTAEPTPAADASCERVDDLSQLVAADGHTVLVAANQGPAGALDRAELWRIAPLWKELAAAYEPDPEAVAALAAGRRDVEVHVALGTWCGDSQRYVPELLKALEAAANPRLGLRLTSIRRGFKEPLDLVRAERLTNVPTVIVIEEGREIGRIVETPAAATMEADLAAILAGQVPEHTGRWQRERLLARGVYRYEDAAGAALGTERWELFADADEGRLLHSRGERGGSVTELWQRRGRDGATVFVEITREGPGETTRSRHWMEDGGLRTVIRGNTTGIVEQTAELPDGWTPLLPAAAAAAPPVGASGRTAGLALGGAGARLEPLTVRDLGDREVATPAGRFQAVGRERRLGSGTSTWWLHPELAVPVAGETEDGGRVVLVEVEISGDEAAEP